MAFFKWKQFLGPSPLVVLYALGLLHDISVKAASFNLAEFRSPSDDIKLQGDAIYEDGIQLTRSRGDLQLIDSIGRALYAKPVQLWDSDTNTVADFNTRFSFSIDVVHPPDGGDGLAFFLAANNTFFSDSGGGCLGLFRESSDFKCNSSTSPLLAVEFDTYSNEWDPPYEHVGININSIKSRKEWKTTLKTKDAATAWVSYNFTTKNLRFFLTHSSNPVFSEEPTGALEVYLKAILPEWVYIGFSATTGLSYELHDILSWEFNSTELNPTVPTISGFPSDPVINSTEPSPTVPTISGFPSDPVTDEGGNRKVMIKLVGAILGGILVFTTVGIILLVRWKKKGKTKNNEDTIFDKSTDDDYERGTGPKKYTYGELVRATNDFAAEGKLGEGGFGSVHRGILGDTNVDVAVKKISKGSKQGKKEFVSEVKIISKLGSRHLVQLLGWCHERGEFILVYEFMPNGSLDFHLFGGRTMLSWALRYKIALGLASAVFYLHEGWEQCVVHRDIKPSNVMLDSSFNAKLGDFGLARFVDHEVGAKTTMVAGTTGYMAPECFYTGKAGKESDVYSFGVVALEIASGRRVVDLKEGESKVHLVLWLWELHRSGRLLEAVDTKLSMDFDEQQMLRLMVVGLWCTSYDYKLRPSMKQISTVLTFESPLPDLPLKTLELSYSMPSAKDFGFSYATSSRNNTNSTKYSSSPSLLHSEPIYSTNSPKYTPSASLLYSSPV